MTEFKVEATFESGLKLPFNLEIDLGQTRNVQIPGFRTPIPRADMRQIKAQLRTKYGSKYGKIQSVRIVNQKNK